MGRRGVQTGRLPADRVPNARPPDVGHRGVASNWVASSGSGAERAPAVPFVERRFVALSASPTKERRFVALSASPTKAVRQFHSPDVVVSLASGWLTAGGCFYRPFVGRRRVARILAAPQTAERAAAVSFAGRRGIARMRMAHSGPVAECTTAVLGVGRRGIARTRAALRGPGVERVAAVCS